MLLNNATAAEWAGIGGDGNDGNGTAALVQSGTIAQEYSDFPGHWTAQYYAFIQDTGSNPDAIEKYTVSCGNIMYADDWQDYSGGKPTAAHMYVEDVTSGQYAESTNTSHFSNGSTAEWILERGTQEAGWPSPYWLADFHTVNFTNCYAVRNGLNYSPINLPHNYSNMYWNNTGYDLDTVGPLSPDNGGPGASFQITWHYSH